MRDTANEGQESSSAPIRLGPFALQEPIGQGAMAVVWRGLHVPTGLPIAAKFAKPREFDERQRKLFRAEVRAVAALHHPGVVRIFDQGDVTDAAALASGGRLVVGSPGLVMELAGGGTLEDSIGRPWDLGWPRLRSILLEVLDALAHAHARGLVHRDLKPSNILRFSDGRLALADFGLVCALGPEMHQSQMDVVVGTPLYMAPEQVTGEWRDFGPWTDLYALGCIAHQLISGRPPFPFASALAVAKGHMMDLPRPPRRRFAIPDGLDDWIARLLRKSPHHRFRCAADAARALRKLGAVSDRLDPDLEQTQPLASGGDVTLASTNEATAANGEPPDAVTLEEELEPVFDPPADVPEHWGESLFEAQAALHGAGLSLFGLRAIPLVGRERVRRTLWDSLREVADSDRAASVVLTGAAGIGKSALARWFAERTREMGLAEVLWLRGARTQADPLATLVRERLGVNGIADSDAARARVDAFARGHGGNAEDVEALMRLVAADPEGSISRGDAIRSAARALELIAAHRPLVFVVDDAHTCSAALDLVLHLLTRDAGGAPILSVVLGRTEDSGAHEEAAATLEAVQRLTGVRSERLGPLDDGERRALARRLLGLEPRLAARVEARSEGNPSFLVQLVGDWVERGLLDLGPRGFELRSDAEVSLPSELDELWSGRIRQVLNDRPASAKRALELAAALGQHISDAEWRAACELEHLPTPSDLVASLIERALALEEDEGWCFAHPAMREVIAASATRSGRWSGHHLTCAGMLAARHEGGERGIAERISHHRLAAGDLAGAVGPLLKAAQERREHSDYGRAAVLLQERDRALTALDRSSDRTAGMLLRARIALHQGDLGDVVAHARWVEELDGIDVDTRTEALRFLGDAARRRGALRDAAEFYETAIALHPRVDNPHGVAASSWGLGDVQRQLGCLERASDLFHRSCSLYREIGDEHGVADQLIGEGDVARQTGDFDRARNYYEHARSSFERLRNRYGVARAQNGIAECERFDGHLQESLHRYIEAERVLVELDSVEAVFPRLNAALSHLGLGELDAATEGLRVAGEVLADRGWGGLLGCVHAGLMACAAGQGDAHAFERALLALRASLVGGVVELDVASACALAGELARERDDLGRAREAYEVAAGHFAALGLGSRERRVRRALRNL